jgi:hypothetical protein
MTVPSPQSPEKTVDKEYNFRMLEAKYEKQLTQERTARIEAERIAQESLQKQQQQPEDDDSEPYVDHKKLNRTLQKFGQQTKQETQSEIQNAVQTALKEERKQNWIKNNPDFYDTLQLAEKFAQQDPALAETILEMPEGFERQKLVYQNIKALGINRPVTKESTIQEKIDANKRSPYYQPASVGSAPYASVSDFSPAGQKGAYDKMQELKNRLRLG